MSTSRPINRTQSLLAKVGLSLIAMALFLIAAEMGFRVVRRVVKGPDSAISDVMADPDLGWCLNTERGGLTKTNRCNETVVLQPYQDRYLVKRAKHGLHPCVLFLGDSYTQGHEVSTGHAYYDVFESLSGSRCAVFAAGVGGFGSLQEYLLLEKVWDEVQPDIVIWQLHSNDLANNVFDLDRSSFLNNQRPRPYLDPNSGQIEFHNPGFFLFDVSHAFRFLFYRLVKLDWKYDLGLLDGADALIAPSEDDSAKLRQQGFEVLELLLDRAIRNHPRTLFFGFSADSTYDRRYREIFERCGAGYFEGVARALDQDPLPTNCLPLDPHWNHHGNRVAGRLLHDLLEHALDSSAPFAGTPTLQAGRSNDSTAH